MICLIEKLSAHLLIYVSVELTAVLQKQRHVVADVVQGDA